MVATGELFCSHMTSGYYGPSCGGSHSAIAWRYKWAKPVCVCVFCFEFSGSVVRQWLLTDSDLPVCEGIPPSSRDRVALTPIKRNGYLLLCCVFLFFYSPHYWPLSHVVLRLMRLDCAVIKVFLSWMWMKCREDFAERWSRQKYVRKGIRAPETGCITWWWL